VHDAGDDLLPAGVAAARRSSQRMAIDMARVRRRAIEVVDDNLAVMLFATEPLN